MILRALLLSRRRRRRCYLYSAAVRAISWCFSLALDLLCLAVVWIALQWFYIISEALQQTDHDVDATNGDNDSGGVDNMEPATPENADIADSKEIIIADTGEIVSGNVKNLISKFEIIEKTDINTADKQVSSHVDQACAAAGIVGQLVKRFDGTEKIPLSDEKPTLEVINTTTAVIHLIDKFNCATV